MNSKIKEHDINKLPNDGYIVFPLSIGRLSSNTGQSPEECMEMIKHFEKKIGEIGMDIVFIYTNGLYYNSDEPSYLVRKKTNIKMIEHKNKMLKLLIRSKKYVPQAVHFMAWDQIIISSEKYQEYFLKLKKEKETNKKFLKYLIEALGEREKSEANFNYMIEELVVTHLIREDLVDFPRTLVKKDKFRLIVYPGPFLKSDFYVWKKRLLPVKNTKEKNFYYSSMYDFSKKVINDFNEVEI